MKIKGIRLALIISACALMFSQAALAQITLPRLISDGMVLQRDAEVRLWGWAATGEDIEIHFLDQTYNITADQDGNWEVILSSLKAGGPYSMEIKASNQLTLNNILVGDVWICSGQSNMVLPMERVQDKYAEEIANSANPSIRQFLVPMRYDFHEPQTDLKAGKWVSADPEKVMKYTATGYFFAKTLYDRYQVPMGLINVSVGGSPVEAWLSEDALQAFPQHVEVLTKYKDDAFVEQILAKDKAVQNAWYKRARQLDKGLAAGETPWFDPAHDASAWETMPIPSYWEDEGLGPVNGIVWFRRTIEVPESMTGISAKLLLGRVVDADSTYVNGQFVGTVSYKYPPRRYILPPGVLKAGENVITVRIINSSGRGGFYPDKPYELIAGEQTIDLKGEWQYKLGAVMDAMPGQTFVRWQPVGLHNGMLAPLVNCRIKGMIWYQGESNTRNPAEYRDTFPALIADWRQEWGQGNFPFLYVQLANYMEVMAEPSESNWAELREVQRKTLDVTENTAMAVIIDTGEWNDIHPLNKKDVGQRLALAAQSVAYGDREIVYSGPLYKSMEVKGKRAYVTFDHVGSGLIAKGGGELKQFAIAGADGRFVWAKAKIKGDKVVVWSDNVPKPVAVRYAWADNPEGANLYNKEGLPASPFQTDE
jgi:sialate O-acetylesterase